ncbi:hypothetical protein MN202_15360 [Rheinheimera muenzenbergensis]|uniref:Uncharacterized protein n=1 Tax=Rheinheimera muenzenbergensis TaxID=1193628 RepID=A0ABU8CAE0_9GAMM
MYRFLSDAINLKAVFGSYSTVEALKVKSYIELVLLRLKIPSKTLLEHMQQEGIALSDFVTAPATTADWAALSETVIRSHLRATFLCPDKLHAALAALSLAQQVEIRDLLLVVSSYLRLPSETLLRRMEEEGLTLDKLGVSTAATDKVAQVRQKLNALARQEPAGQGVTDTDSLASVKQRISELKKHSNDTEQQPPVPQNVVSLTGAVGKLKASM